jgi:hypothetical protein
MSEQQIAEQVRDTVQRWLDGKVSATEFEVFLKTSNASLDQIMAEKAAKERRDWEDLNWRTMY